MSPSRKASILSQGNSDANHSAHKSRHSNQSHRSTGSGSLNNENESEQECITEEIVIPPDGGWGWVVVVSAFVCNLVVDGTLYSFGILVNPIYNATDENQKSLTAITWVGSLSLGFSVLGGPIVSVLANKYGFRSVSILGSGMACLGYLGAWIVGYFTEKPNLVALYILYGTIGGFGCCFIFVPSVVAVGFYFDKRRALATGIAICGSGIGTFVYPPIVNLIIETYSWNEAFLFLSLTAFISGLFGLCYRPVKPTSVIKGRFHRSITRNSFPSLGGLMILINVNTSTRHDSETSLVSNTSVTRTKSTDTGVHSITNETISADEHVASSPEQELTNIEAGDQMDVLDQTTSTEMMHTLPKDSLIAIEQEEADNEVTTEKRNVKKFPIMVLPTARGSNRMEKCCHQLFDFTLFSSRAFQLFSISSFLYFFGSLIPFIFLNELTKENIQLERSKSTFLISLIGIGNVIGRIGGGWIADHPKVNALLLNNASITVMGICLLGMPYFRQYWQFLLTTTLIGVCMGNAASIRAILLVQLLGLSKLTNAFGVVLMMYGFGIFLGLPFGAFLKEITDGYTIPFLASGGVLILAGVFCYPINCVKHWDDAQAKKKLEIETTTEESGANAAEDRTKAQSSDNS